MKVWCVFTEDENGNNLKLNSLYTTQEGAFNKFVKLNRKGEICYCLSKSLKGNLLEFMCKWATNSLKKKKILKNNQTLEAVKQR